MRGKGRVASPTQIAFDQTFADIDPVRLSSIASLRKVDGTRDLSFLKSVFNFWILRDKANIFPVLNRPTSTKGEDTGNCDEETVEK